MNSRQRRRVRRQAIARAKAFLTAWIAAERDSQERLRRDLVYEFGRVSPRTNAVLTNLGDSDTL